MPMVFQMRSFATEPMAVRTWWIVWELMAAQRGFWLLLLLLLMVAGVNLALKVFRRRWVGVGLQKDLKLKAGQM